MSTRYNNGSHYENHQRAAELHDEAAHMHRVAEQNGQQDHLTGQEHSRQALEHSQEAHQSTQAVTVGHGITAFGHEDIAVLARELWQARGCPDGSRDGGWVARGGRTTLPQFRSLTPYAAGCRGVRTLSHVRINAPASGR